MGYPGHKLRLLPLPTDLLVATVGWTFAENNGGREIKMEVGEKEEKGDEKWQQHRNSEAVGGLKKTWFSSAEFES